MIIEPAQAKNYHCCAMDKRCSGPTCMAWRKEKVLEKMQPAYPFEPLVWKDTGRGFCGLAGQV